MAAMFAPLLSMVIFSGSPWVRMALYKNASAGVCEVVWCFIRKVLSRKLSPGVTLHFSKKFRVCSIIAWETGMIRESQCGKVQVQEAKPRRKLSCLALDSMCLIPVSLAVRLGVEEGLPYQAASWHLWRDHRVFVPSATIQNWVEAGGGKRRPDRGGRVISTGASRTSPGTSPSMSYTM